MTQTLAQTSSSSAPVATQSGGEYLTFTLGRGRTAEHRDPETHELVIENIDLSLRHCFNETMRLIEPRVRAKGLKLRTQVDEAVPDSFRGDAGRVRQVLLNLLGKAIKFTQRGVIDVSIESIAINDESAWLHFTVRDTGAGIPAARQSQIFEAFAQTDKSSTREYGGNRSGAHDLLASGGSHGRAHRRGKHTGLGQHFSFLHTRGVRRLLAMSAESVEWMAL